MSKGTGRRPLHRRAVFWVAMCIPVLLVLYGVLLYFTLPRTNGEEVRLREFFAAAAAGSIDSAVLLDVDNRVFFEQGGRDHWVGLPASQQYLDRFVDDALEQDIPLDVDQQELKTLLEPATYIVPALLIVSAFLLFFLLMRSGAASPFLKAAARRGAGDRPVTFADVAGVDDAVEEIREVRDYLMNPQRFLEIGAEPPRGILLIGPPGTGKTLLARAVAGEAGVPFFAMSGTDFVEMYVGVGAARVRDLFRQVRERAPAILFIDEIDAVGRTRVGGATAGQDERDQTLNQLLVELDGFYGASGVVLIGATNRPDVLDPALLRRGRFDRQIVVDRPDRTGRLAILQVHARGKRLDPSVDVDRLAARTSGFTGADLASVINEAALLTARRGKAAITEPELEEAIDRIVLGSQGRARLLSPAEKRTVAFHEAGHAIVGWAFPGTGQVTKISIMSRGRSLGATWTIPEEEKLVVSRGELEQRIAGLLGGRVAEEVALGEPSSSARDDLRRATAIARTMVCDLGMSEALGPRSLGSPAGPYLGDGRVDVDYSPEVAGLIDREIQRLLQEGRSRAMEIVVSNRPTLDDLAARLVERETLREPDLVEFTARIGAPRRVPAGGGGDPAALQVRPPLGGSGPAEPLERSIYMRVALTMPRRRTVHL